MILRTLLTAAVLVTAAHADFDRQIATSAQPDLYVSTGSGRIQIHPGSDSEIHIKAHVHAGSFSGDNVQDRMRRISEHPPIQVSGSTVRIGDTSPEDQNLYKNIIIDYEISAPRQVALNLRSGSGDLEISDLGRFLKADTGSGSVRAHGISGPADLRTGSGDIEVELRVPGEIRAITGSGSVRVNGLNGALTARTGSGDIEANGSITGNTKLQTGSGSVRLHLGHDARYNLNASTGSGTIRAGQGRSTDHHHMSEAINGGGPTVEVQTGSGDIEIN